MQLMHRYDVEVDLCPKCKGVWLDKGEIDEIAGIQTTYVSKFNKKNQYMYKENDYDIRLVHYKKRKKSALLGNMFDFDNCT
jgi:Zn-finger nucleic acid-binding protein